MRGDFGKLSRQRKDRESGCFNARLEGITEAPASLRPFTAPQFKGQFASTHS
jgi:hypothetical protein